MILPVGDNSHAIMFFLALSADGKTGATGKSPTVEISKNGAAFAAPVGSVAEVGYGWYSLTPDSGDTATAGVLALHAEEADCDPADVRVLIVAINPYQQENAGIGGIPQAAPGTDGGLPVLNTALHVQADVAYWRGEEPSFLTSGGDVPADVKQWASGAVPTFPANFDMLNIDNTNGLLEVVLVSWDYTALPQFPPDFQTLIISSGWVSAYVQDIDQTALAQFVTDDTGQVTAAAGSVAKLAQGSGAGLTAQQVANALGMTPEGSPATGSVYAELNAIQARTDLITPETTNVTATVDYAGTITITRGDDYISANGTAIELVIADYAGVDLTGATLAFGLGLKPTGRPAIVSAVPTFAMAGGDLTITIQLDKGTHTDAIEPGTYLYDVQATKAGKTTTLARGDFVVQADVTP